MATITEANSAVSSGDSSGTSALQKAIKDSRIPWMFILPSVLVMAFVTVYPQAYQVWMSATNYDERHFTPQNSPDIVYLDNFVDILRNDIAISNYDFFRIFAFNIFWTLVNVFFHVTIGVAVAMLLNSHGLLFRRFYRSLFVLAWATPQYIAALVWRNAFNQRFGAVNLALAEINESLGTHFPTDTRWLVTETPPVDIPGIAWPLDIFEILPTAFYGLLLANIWFGWPFMMIVATGALQSIPKELYEAADVDGASPWRQFWAITVPLIRPAMVPAIMLGTIWTFNAFNVIYFITGGGPSRKSEILVTQSYNLLNETSLNGRYGMAAAFSLVVFVILFVITIVNNYITGATEAYYES